MVMGSQVTAPLLRWNVGSKVRSAIMSHNSSRIASGSDDRLVRIWNVRTGALVLDPLNGHTSWVLSVAWSHDDTLLVSGSQDHTIRIWDARTGALIGKPLRGHTGWVYSVAVSPDSARIVSGSGDNTIRVWDVATGAPIGEPLKGHIYWVISVAFSPDSTRIVSGSADKTIRMWDAYTGALIGEPLRGHTDVVWPVAFSPDSTRIVSGSYDKTVRMWDAHTGVAIGESLRGHTSYVSSVAFSHDSTRIVSSSSDKTMRMWDARTGAPIGQPLTGHARGVNSVAFSPDSTCIVSGSSDGTICVWRTPWTTSSADTVISDLHTTPSFEMVTSKMSVQEVFECLVNHGCSDLTLSADTTRSSAVITSGGFGDVRRLVMDNGTVVAIKTLRLHILRNDDKAIKRAVREVYIWSRLGHVNVQELLGIIVFQGGLGMVSPWMEHGNLKEYLKEHPDVERYPLCIQVASGVSYLHSIGTVHGDLKANNVLVSDKGILKINDFDYAILPETSLQFSATTRHGGGTLRWMAPELLERDEDDDEAPRVPATRCKETDVYALGMTLLEIVTGNVPYVEYKRDMSIYGAVHAKKPPKRPKVLGVPDKMANGIWDLFLRCWDHDASARPDAASLLAELNGLAA